MIPCCCNIPMLIICNCNISILTPCCYNIPLLIPYCLHWIFPYWFPAVAIYPFYSSIYTLLVWPFLLQYAPFDAWCRRLESECSLLKGLFSVSFEKLTQRFPSEKLANINKTYKFKSIFKPANSFVGRTFNLFSLSSLVPISAKYKLVWTHLRYCIALGFCP